MADDVRFTVEAIDQTSAVLDRILEGMRAIAGVAAATQGIASKAFDGITASTTGTAQATEKVGVAAKQTEEPLRKAGESATRLGQGLRETAVSAGEASSSLLPVVATIGDLKAGVDKTFGALVQYVKQSTMAAAETQMLGTALRVAAINSGYTSDQIISTEKGVTKLGIATAEARKVMTGFIQSQLDVTKATGLARAAQDLAVAAQMNSSDAAASLTHAIGLQNAQSLRSFGLITTNEQIYEKYARAVNKTADALTTAEKKQAFLNEILGFAAAAAGTYEASMEDVGKQFKSMARYQDEAALSIGQIFLPIMKVVVKVMTEFYKWMADLSPVMKVVIGTVVAFAGVLSAAIGVIVTVATVVRAWQFAVDSLTKALTRSAALKAANLALDAATIPAATGAATATGLFAGAMTWLAAAMSTATGGLLLVVTAISAVVAAWLGYKNIMTPGDDAQKVADAFEKQREAMSKLNAQLLISFSTAQTAEERQKALTAAHDAAAKALKSDLIPAFTSLAEAQRFFATAETAKEMSLLAAQSEALRQKLHAEKETIAEVTARMGSMSAAGQKQALQLQQLTLRQTELAEAQKKRLEVAAAEEEAAKRFDELAGSQLFTQAQQLAAMQKADEQYLLVAKRIDDAREAQRKLTEGTKDAVSSQEALEASMAKLSTTADKQQGLWKDISSIFSDTLRAAWAGAVLILQELGKAMDAVWETIKSFGPVAQEFVGELGKIIAKVTGLDVVAGGIGKAFSWVKGVIGETAASLKGFREALETVTGQTVASTSAFTAEQKKQAAALKETTAAMEAEAALRTKVLQGAIDPAAASLMVKQYQDLQAARRRDGLDLEDWQKKVLAAGQAYLETAKMYASPTAADQIAVLRERMTQLGGAVALTRDQWIALLPALEAAFIASAKEGTALDAETLRWLAMARAASNTVKAISDVDSAHQSMAKSLRPGVDTLAVLTSQFARLSETQKQSVEAQRTVTATVEKANEEYRKIPPTLLAAYMAIQEEVRNLQAAGVEKLRAKGITEQLIVAELASGKTLANLALQYGVTTDYLSRYRSELGLAKQAEDAIRASMTGARTADESGPGATQAELLYRNKRDLEEQYQLDVKAIRDAAGLSDAQRDDMIAARAIRLKSETAAAERASNLAVASEEIALEEKVYQHKLAMAALMNAQDENSREFRKQLAEDDYAATLKSIEDRKFLGTITAEQYAAEIAMATEKRDNLVALATETADTLTIRMKQQGIVLQAEYREQARAAKAMYDEMVRQHQGSLDDRQQQLMRFYQAQSLAEGRAGVLTMKQMQQVVDYEKQKLKELEASGTASAEAIAAQQKRVADAISATWATTRGLTLEIFGSIIAAAEKAGDTGTAAIAKIAAEVYVKLTAATKTTEKFSAALAAISQIAQLAGMDTGAALAGIAANAVSAYGQATTGVGKFAVVANAAGQAITSLSGDNKWGKATGQALQFAATGAMIGSAFGPIGTAVGAVAGAVVGFVSSLAGSAKAMREANKEATDQIQKLKAELVNTYGSLANISAMGKMVGIDLAGAWGDQSQAGLKNFAGLMDEFQKKLGAIQSATQKYGLTWKDLSSEWKTFQFGLIAEGLKADWDALLDAGVDTEKAIRAMAPALYEFIKTSEETGMAIPANMQPIIDKLREIEAAEGGVVAGSVDMGAAVKAAIAQYPTTAEVTKFNTMSVEIVKKAYDQMVASGLYSVDVLKAAWQAWQDALVDAGDEVAIAAKKARDASAEIDAGMGTYKTIEDLQKLASVAEGVYKRMVASGKYSAETLKTAWQDWQDKLVASGDATAVATKKSADAIKQIDDEIKSLTASIAMEAPEAEMGVVEQQTRKKIAELEKQKAAEVAKLEAAKAAELAAIEATKKAEAQKIAEGRDQEALAIVVVEEKFGKLFKDVVSVSAASAAEVARQWSKAPWEDWPSKPIDKLAGGTQGVFRDFGLGTRVVLHGRERVMTEEEGRFEAQMSQARSAVRAHKTSAELSLPPALVTPALAANQTSTATAMRAQMALQRQLAASRPDATPGAPVNVVIQAWDSEDVAKRGVPQLIKALKTNAYHQTAKFKDALGLT